jgi:hypothetical protein
MTTALCLKNKMDLLDKQINASKLTDSKCSNYDISYNLLKKENELLTKHIENQKHDDDKIITDDKLPSNVSAFHITLIYTLLLCVIGLFYNSLLTYSIGTILNEDVKLTDFLQVGNSFNYNIIWTKVQSCLNKFRFYLFITTFMATLLINVGIIYLIILKGKKVYNAIKVVSLTSIAVIGITSLLTCNVSFVKIFENTFGYAVATLFSPKKDYSFHEFVNSIFVHDTFSKGGIDFTFIFSAFRLDNLGDIIRDIGIKNPESKYDFYINSENVLNNNLNLLASSVVLKNTVGYMTWILFSSITSTIISVKYLSREK